MQQARRNRNSAESTRREFTIHFGHELVSVQWFETGGSVGLDYFTFE